MLARRTLFLSLVLACTASTQTHHVHTDRQGARMLPLPKGDDVFHFVVYGDRTGGPAEGIEVLKQAVHDTNLLDPDLVMTVGDLIQGYNTESPWLTQMSEYRRVMGKLHMPWYPVAGNHDVYWRGPDSPLYQHEENYETHFGPLWYWFEHKDCGFFVLYSDEGDRESGRKGYHDPEVNQFSEEQLSWLRRELENARELEHVFVFLHHPKWREWYYEGSTWNSTVHPMLAQWGNVRAVFAGHIHQMTYGGERDGIEYFTLATVGGGLPAEVPGLGLMHHLNVVTVRDSGIEVATIPVGQVADPRRFTDDYLADANLARELKPTLRTDLAPPIRFQMDGSTSSDVAVAVTNPCEAPIEVTLSLDVPGGGYWFLSPDHTHGRIEPGATERFRFKVMRSAEGFGEFVIPTLGMRTDYLRSGLRLTMPEQTVELPVDLTELPVDDGEAPDHVLSLSGDGYVAIDPSMLADLPDGPLTLETWMRAEKMDRRIGLVAKTESSEFGIFVSDRIATFSVHAGGRYGNAKDQGEHLKEGRWHHLAGVFDGEVVRVYVDGRLVGREARAGERRRNDLPLIVGGDVSGRGEAGTSLFAGELDEVRLSTSARYTGESFEPQRRLRPDDSTWLLLHFDTSVGPFHPDASGNGRHGRAVGRVELVPAESGSREQR